MSSVAFDTLEFVEHLKEAGIPEKQAKAIAEAQKQAFFEVLDSSLATKADVTSVKSELRTDLLAVKSALNSAMMAVQSELYTELLELKSALNSDLTALQSELHTELLAVKSELHSELKLLKWMLALVILVSVIPTLKAVFA